ncbi:hypothetical protein FS837_010150 [Tulasnella sp. UAMH 9824]|nr:hypothetical protein FS837_010150 [Tulasnella sp. UAMH 9824]
MFGEARSAERRARTIDLAEHPPEHVKARFPDQLSPVPPSNSLERVETSEIPPRELSSTCDPELLSPSPWYEGDVPTECLRTASMAPALRRRLRAQVRRARLVAEDVANPGFSLENLSFLGSAPPVETDGVAVNLVDESAGDIVGSMLADAPIVLDAGLYEPSPESTSFLNATSNEAASIQPFGFDGSFCTETMNFESTSRDSRASSSSSHSVLEFGHCVSDHLRTVENPAALKRHEEKDVKSERSVYDPVLRCFSLPALSSHGPTGSAEIVDRTVDDGWSESAGAKAESLVPVAPAPYPRVSPLENGRVVIKFNTPTLPITVRPQYPQRRRSMSDRIIDPDNSHLALPNCDPSTTDSVESNGRYIDAQWVWSAGETEAKSSIPAAPIPPTAALRFEPYDIVILVTPPSPPSTIRSSLSHNYARDLGMNPDSSHPVSHHPELARSVSQGINPCLDFQKPVDLAKPLPPTDAEVLRNPIEGEAQAQNETVEQLSFFDMLALGGSIDDADQTVDRVQDSSAADEAETSFSVEPGSTLLSRKAATFNRAMERPMPRPVQHRVRALTSRVASTLRKWGKTRVEILCLPSRNASRQHAF